MPIRAITWFRPWMAWLAAVIALVLAVAWLGVQLADERTDHANTKTEWSQEREGYAKAVVASAETARLEERRRFEAQRGIVDAANLERDEALGQLDAAKSAGVRMRTQLTRLQAILASGGTCKEPSSGQGSEAADKTLDLLADVQRRIDEAADGIAGFADESFIAGTACERSYDSLSKVAR